MLPTHLSPHHFATDFRTFIRTFRLQERRHLGTEFPVTIKHRWVWERPPLPEWLHNPLARRVRGPVEGQDAHPMVLDDTETVQHAETQRGTVKKSKAASR